MTEKRFTTREMVEMNSDEFMVFLLSLDVRAYRLMGVPWKNWVSVEREPGSGDIVFQYE